MKNVIDAIMTRYSVRKFTGEVVSEADLDTIIRAGMAAPSAVNVQPWAFIVITDRAIMDTLCSKLPYAKMLDKAGAAIVVCGIPEKDSQFGKDYWLLDCSAATENILLAAHGLGYGAVWTAVYPEAGRISIVRKYCEIPESVVPLNVIPVGVPEGEPSAPIDKYVPGNIHVNIW